MTILMTLLTLSMPIHAQTVDEIIEKARDVQQVDNGIQQMRMVMTGRSGSTRERRFEMRLKTSDDVVKSYVRFSHPTDVAGTQLVMVDHPDRVDEQILYLPALKRTNRIAGKARSGSFMGSDFSYEDLEISGVDTAKHTLVSEDDKVWVIDTVPGDDSTYGRIRAHVSKGDYLPRTIEFFDKKAKAVKVLTITDTAMDEGTVIPKRSVMKNLQRGTQTELVIESWRLNLSETEIPDETFTAGYLERNG